MQKHRLEIGPAQGYIDDFKTVSRGGGEQRRDRGRLFHGKMRDTLLHRSALRGSPSGYVLHRGGEAHDDFTSTPKGLRHQFFRVPSAITWP